MNQFNEIHVSMRVAGEFEIKFKTTLDEANAMQIAYVDTKNKNSCVDGIRRAFICNVRQLNRLIQFHLFAFSFHSYHANIISNCIRLVIKLREYISFGPKITIFNFFSLPSQSRFIKM